MLLWSFSNYFSPHSLNLRPTWYQSHWTQWFCLVLVFIPSISLLYISNLSCHTYSRLIWFLPPPSPVCSELHEHDFLISECQSAQPPSLGFNGFTISQTSVAPGTRIFSFPSVSGTPTPSVYFYKDGQLMDVVCWLKLSSMKTHCFHTSNITMSDFYLLVFHCRKKKEFIMTEWTITQ